MAANQVATLSREVQDITVPGLEVESAVFHRQLDIKLEAPVPLSISPRGGLLFLSAAALATEEGTQALDAVYPGHASVLAAAASFRTLRRAGRAAGIAGFAEPVHISLLP